MLETTRSGAVSLPVPPRADGARLPEATGESLSIECPALIAPKAISIRYLGFSDVEGRREYTLRAQRGLELRPYTVWIELAAFSKRQAMLQDGPDICYQKLLSEVAKFEMQGSDRIAVTEEDLAGYRATHTRVPRSTFSSPPTPRPADLPAETSDPRP